MYSLTKAISISAALLLSACTAPLNGNACQTRAADVLFQDDKANANATINFQVDSAWDPTLGRAKPILDLIGFTEGTDRGDGYNETLAYGAFTNGDVCLTDMTLAEIDALQTQMLAHPRNSWSSSAIGRYQIVRTTLRKLKSTMHLADTLRFTPELQDTLAIELLKGRGYEAWRAGNITDAQFALNLSKEWASLPNPYSDTGYYAGQHAAVSYIKVELVLAEAR
jgi:muramidase (phage lysozyme)